MGIRSAIRYLGLMMLVSLYVASGIGKLLSPESGAALLAKSNFPYFLKLAGIQLSSQEYRQLIQVTGAIFLSFSIFILLGIGRSFFSFLLAMGTVVITVSFFVNLENPLDMPEENQFNIMKNLAIIGALLFVSGSGQRVRRSHNGGATAASAEETHRKKNQ